MKDTGQGPQLLPNMNVVRMLQWNKPIGEINLRETPYLVFPTALNGSRCRVKGAVAAKGKACHLKQLLGTGVDVEAQGLSELYTVPG